MLVIIIYQGLSQIEISNLAGLKVIHLNNNQFSSLPDLSSMLDLDSLFIENNHLTFKDLEPNIGVPNAYFSYAPQANINTEEDFILYLTSEMFLYVSTGGENSLYQWYKDDLPIGVQSNDSTFLISSVSLTDAGEYTCEVTNTVASELTLTSLPATIEVVNAILVDQY